jgi:nucleotide-binding universal stress UspA family protein
MAKITRIMVTTDFSEAGNTAVAYAFDLAAQLGATVLLTTVIEKAAHESRYFIDYTPLESKENLQKAQKQAATELEALIPSGFKSKVKYQIVPFVDDSAAKGILDVAKEKKAQMLVIADHGMSKFERLVLGSTTDRIMRTIDIPVLLVKKGE